MTAGRKKLISDCIFDDLPLADTDLIILDNFLTKILRESDESKRKKLKQLLKKWQTRVCFVNVLQEAKDMQI